MRNWCNTNAGTFLFSKRLCTKKSNDLPIVMIDYQVHDILNELGIVVGIPVHPTGGSVVAGGSLHSKGHLEL
jgi:hypothetical protein